MCPALVTFVLAWFLATSPELQWPAPPAEARVRFETIIDLGEATPASGFWSRFGRFIGGGDEADRLGAPFDLEVQGDVLWMTCQEVPGLVRLDRSSLEYRVYVCEELPVRQPVAPPARLARQVRERFGRSCLGCRHRGSPDHRVRRGGARNQSDRRPGRGRCRPELPDLPGRRTRRKRAGERHHELPDEAFLGRGRTPAAPDTSRSPWRPQPQ